MNLTSWAQPQSRYHRNAYHFVFEALSFIQQKLGREPSGDPDDVSAHVSGQELLDGIRELGVARYGLLAKVVFAHWGVTSTGDFGRIVFELIERNEMRKTDRDQLSDFLDVYDFEDVFDREYSVNVKNAFSR